MLVTVNNICSNWKYSVSVTINIICSNWKYVLFSINSICSNTRNIQNDIITRWTFPCILRHLREMQTNLVKHVFKLYGLPWETPITSWKNEEKVKALLNQSWNSFWGRVIMFLEEKKKEVKRLCFLDELMEDRKLPADAKS